MANGETNWYEEQHNERERARKGLPPRKEYTVQLITLDAIIKDALKKLRKVMRDNTADQ